MARPGYALFARMQAISPAYSTLYDTAPQMIRSCEPLESTDTFVSRGKHRPCMYSYWYTSMGLAVQSPEHRQCPQQRQCKHPKYLEYLRHSKYCTPRTDHRCSLDDLDISRQIYSLPGSLVYDVLYSSSCCRMGPVYSALSSTCFLGWICTAVCRLYTTTYHNGRLGPTVAGLDNDLSEV